MVTETTHFRIFHQQPKEYVEKVALIAERTRVAMSRKWFNQETGAWLPVPDFLVDTNSNTIPARLTHTALFAVSVASGAKMYLPTILR